MINISVLVTTLNEAENLPRCLATLKDFDEIIVIDSGSTDGTINIAKSFGVGVEDFNWNGDYPKKRQWCLDNLEIKNDFIFFIDGDEEVTPALIEEIKALDLKASGYFVKGQYLWNDQKLKYGLQNNKLVLFNRHKIEFPVIDDLDINGMGEMEGHYQPVLKEEYAGDPIKQVRAPLLHYAYEDEDKWNTRHDRYAMWEAQMIKRNAYPVDPNKTREVLKRFFRRVPLRGVIAFCHCYILKLGFLDGAAGYEFARSRLHYYQAVSAALASNKVTGTSDGIDKARFAPEK